ncbi:MAG: hypothetical protein JXR94_14350 [Candidatus Hydrogenedentes bacterium]|nr:hypothetical protein [Candidatus Hydrogenedentota bacterium]
MIRLNFGTFLQDDSNREAFEACLRVADLEEVERPPLLLLGEGGCGKTHLLYAIVNRIRLRPSRAGLAYVSAHDFPDQVRALIDDPSPLDRKEAAILLVDQLEGFTDLVEELEAVIQIFLDRRGQVVLASSMHPDRLQHLTPGLREMLRAGTVIEIAPRDAKAQIEMIKREARREFEAQAESQHREIEGLRRLVEQAGQGAVSGEMAELRKLLEAEREEKQELGRRYNVARAFSDSVQQELASVKEELGQTRAYARQASGPQNVQAEKATLERRIGDLTMELASARQEGQKARSEANQLLQRAEGLLNQIEANRAAFAQKEGVQQERIRELEGRLEESQVSAAAQTLAEELKIELATLQSRTETEREAFEERIGELEAGLAAAQTDMEEARGELARLEEERNGFQEALGDAVAAREQLEGELREQQEICAGQEQDMDALRHEAAAQVAEAQAQAGEIEGRLARVEAAFERTCEVGRNAGYELESVAEEVRRASDALADLANRLGQLDTPADEAGHAAAERAAMDEVLANGLGAADDAAPYEEPIIQDYAESLPDADVVRPEPDADVVRPEPDADGTPASDATAGGGSDDSAGDGGEDVSRGEAADAGVSAVEEPGPAGQDAAEQDAAEDAAAEDAAAEDAAAEADGDEEPDPSI